MKTDQSQKSRVILMADDNSDDRLLLKRAFTKAGIMNPIREAKTGAEAVAYLEGKGEFADRTKHPFPGILLLDLNMPIMNGFEVLEWIRANLPRHGILIIVLSRIEEIRQVNRAYALGANSFLTKPGEEDDLNALIGAFADYWLLRNTPPSLPGQAAGR